MNFFKRMKFRILINKGRSLMDKCKYDKAKEKFMEARSINNRDSAVYYLLGLIEARQENFEPAIEYLRSSLELNPEGVQYKFDLALCYVETGEYDKAEELFEDLIYRYEKEQSLLVYACDLYHRKGDIDKAIKLIEDIPYEERGEPKLSFMLAKYYHEKGKDRNIILELLEESKQKATYLRDKELIKQVEDFENEINI